MCWGCGAIACLYPVAVISALILGSLYYRKHPPPKAGRLPGTRPPGGLVGRATSVGIKGQSEGGAIIAITCGHCSSISQVQVMGKGYHEFTCPVCKTANRINIRQNFKPSNAENVQFPQWWPQQEGSPSLNLERKELVQASEEVKKAVQAMFDSTWRETATRDRLDGKTAKKMRVVKVEHNLNHRSWVNYSNARQEVRDQVSQKGFKIEQRNALTSDEVLKWPCLGGVDSTVNEYVLFHGTQRKAVESICKSDFMISLSGTRARSLLYGKGVYFADSCSKSDEYAAKDKSDGYCTMLLCRVTCGQMFYTAERTPDTDKLVEQCTKSNANFHSILGDREKARGTYKEYVIYNNDLSYPEFVVTYAREEASED